MITKFPAESPTAWPLAVTGAAENPGGIRTRSHTCNRRHGLARNGQKVAGLCSPGDLLARFAGGLWPAGSRVLRDRAIQRS